MEVIRKMRERLASENGSVGVVVALVIFLVMGMLTMTWNTAELSKTKMRLQNAADSAALAHAIWQARGMNAVQNINDEMYEGLSLACKLRKWGEGFEIAAQALDALSNIPYIGWVLKGFAIVFHTLGVLVGGAAGWLGARICKYFLRVIEVVYAYVASAMGLWNAQQLAAQNEADPLMRLGSSSSLDFGDWHFGIYALGMSYPFKDAFKLPLDKSGKDEVKKEPWKADKIDVFDSSTQPWKTLYKIAGAGEGWEVTPYVSKRGDKEGIKVTKEKKDGKEETKVDDQGVMPGPTVWMSFKLGGNIHTLPIDGFWNAEDSKRKTHKIPFIAVAAAQCITGDVIPHSKKTEEDKSNQRPSGFGAGATAKLVPVSQMFYNWKKASGYIVDAIVYH